MKDKGGKEKRREERKGECFKLMFVYRLYNFRVQSDLSFSSTLTYFTVRSCFNAGVNVIFVRESVASHISISKYCYGVCNTKR